MEPSPLELPPDAWGAFAAEAWDRAPWVLRRPFATGFPTTADVFGALLASADRIRGGMPEALRLYPEFDSPTLPDHLRLYGARVASPYPFLPRPADRTLERYTARLGRALGGRRFGIVLNDCQTYFPIWWKIQGFLAGLYRTIGVVTGGAGIVAFVGNYRSTPFGIHKDLDHVFTFVISGHKNMLLWPLETLANSDHPEVPARAVNRDVLAYVPDHREHERLMRTAIRIEGRPGDLLYWPRSYWHMARGGDELAVSLALGVRFARPAFLGGVPRAFQNHAGEWTPDEVRGRVDATGRRAPSPAFAGLLQRLPAGPAGQQIRRDALESWMRFVSGGGFDPTPIPPPPSHALRAIDWIRGHPGRPVAWTPAGARELILSANAQTFRCPADPRVARLVERINTGVPLRVGSLLAEHAGRIRVGSREYEASRDGIKFLLDVLWSWGAVSLVPRGSRARPRLTSRSADGRPRASAPPRPV